MTRITGWTYDLARKSESLIVILRPFVQIRNLVVTARQQRLLRAKELLDGTFLKVNEVAAQVGFRHASSFTRDFKSLYGYLRLCCAPHSGVLAHRHGPDDFLSVHGPRSGPRRQAK